ncbi:MAG: hypothetical protein WDW38_008503 [Sanguina aurantia]
MAASDSTRVIVSSWEGEKLQSQQQGDAAADLGAVVVASGSGPGSITLLGFSPYTTTGPSLLAVSLGSALLCLRMELNPKLEHHRCGSFPCGSRPRWRALSWCPSQPYIVAVAHEDSILIGRCATAGDTPASNSATLATFERCADAPRSSLVSIAWCNGNGVPTLVVSWATGVEVLQWPLAHNIQGIHLSLEQQDSSWASSNCSRRQLLLGLPGPFRAMATGPLGSILATLDAPLSTSTTIAALTQPRPQSPTPAAAGTANAGDVSRPHSLQSHPADDKGGGGAGGEEVGQAEGVGAAQTGMVDLTQRWEGAESLTGLGADPKWAGATGTLAGLLDISGTGGGSAYGGGGSSSSWLGGVAMSNISGTGRDDGGRSGTGPCVSGSQDQSVKPTQVVSNSARLVVFWPNCSPDFTQQIPVLMDAAAACSISNHSPSPSGLPHTPETAACDRSSSSSQPTAAAPSQAEPLPITNTVGPPSLSTSRADDRDQASCAAVHELTVPFPRPDILQVQGSLVAISSSTGPARMQLCRVTASGLQPQHTFGCSIDSATGPATCRLRGLAFTNARPPLHPSDLSPSSAGGQSQARQQGSGRSERAASTPGSQQAVGCGRSVMVLLSRLEPPSQAAAAAAAAAGQAAGSQRAAGGCEGGLVLCCYPLQEHSSESAVSSGAGPQQASAGPQKPTGGADTHEQASERVEGAAADVLHPTGSTGTATGTASSDAAVVTTGAASGGGVGGGGGGGSGGGQPGLMEQLAALVAGLQSHLDSRLDVMQGSIDAHAARLAGIDGTLQQLRQ